MIRPILNLLAAALLLSACGVGARRAHDSYVVKARQSPAACVSRAVIAVAEPETAPGLETARIAVFETPSHLTYYTGVKWAAPLPQMLQAFFFDALQQSRAFRSVALDTDALSPDLILMLMVRDFEVVGVPSPSVRVNLTARLVSEKTHLVLASLQAGEELAPTANHMPSLVEAFTRAANDAAAQVVRAAIAASPGCKPRAP